MPGSGFPLRTSVFPMGAGISIGDENRIGGLFAPTFSEFDNLYSEFNRTYVWVMDNTLVGNFVNNTYSGVLKQLQMNLSDACLIPNERSPYADVVEFGEVSDTSPVVLISPLNVKPYPNQILTQLFRFSMDIAFLLLITMYTFARVLKKSEGAAAASGQRVLDGMWQMILMMLNQAQVSPVTIAGRILVILTGIGVFFWLQIWQNSMQIEMVAYDRSAVIRTLEEAVMANKTAVMTRTEAATMQVEEKAAQDPDSHLAHLLRRAMFNNADEFRGDDPRGFDFIRRLTPKILNQYVFILSTRIMGCAEGTICALLKNVNPTFDMIVGDEIIVDVFQGQWINPVLNPQYKELLRKKGTKIREHGFGQRLTQLVGHEIRQLVKQSYVDQDIDCFYRSLEAFIGRKFDMKRDAMVLHDLDDVFRLLLCATLVSLLTLLLEKSGLIEAVSKKYLMVGPALARNSKRPAARGRQVWQSKRRPHPKIFVVRPVH